MEQTDSVIAVIAGHQAAEAAIQKLTAASVLMTEHERSKNISRIHEVLDVKTPRYTGPHDGKRSHGSSAHNVLDKEK